MADVIVVLCKRQVTAEKYPVDFSTGRGDMLSYIDFYSRNVCE